DAAAQHALQGYCAKLDEVARLETCGTFLERGFANPAQSVLHVIARTSTGSSRKYFYRRLLNNAAWTPWENGDVDIDGTEEPGNSGVQLLPFVWNKRLYLFWLIFTRKKDEPKIGPVAAPYTPDNPASYWEIKLAWSLYENGRWAQKRVSSAAGL